MSGAKDGSKRGVLDVETLQGKGEKRNEEMGDNMIVIEED